MWDRGKTAASLEFLTFNTLALRMQPANQTLAYIVSCFYIRVVTKELDTLPHKQTELCNELGEVKIRSETEGGLIKKIMVQPVWDRTLRNTNFKLECLLTNIYIFRLRKWALKLKLIQFVIKKEDYFISNLSSRGQYENTYVILLLHKLIYDRIV